MEEQLKVFRQIRTFIGFIAAALILVAVVDIIQFFQSSRLLPQYQTYLEAGVGSESEKFRRKVSDLFTTGDYSKAIELIKGYQQNHPNDAYAFYDLGKAYLSDGQYQEAIKSLETAESMMPAWKEKWTGPLIQQAKEKMGKN